MRWLGMFAVLVLLLVGLVAVVVGAFAAAVVWNARSGEPMLKTAPIQSRRPASAVAADDAQILFGDLHVHTAYSADAFLQSYSIREREGRRPPADACDFARFCSQLDFWSINDHAESLTPEHWRATVDAVRECNAAAGDPNDPDLVSFLGWEWSHAGRAETHYGHKNVVLRGTRDEEIPSRPIASAAGPPLAFIGLGTLGPVVSSHSFWDFASFHRYAMDTLEVEDCAADVPVRELPSDCRESATTPRELFAKLEDWGLPALVIPHGLSWGTTNPAHARLDVQLRQQDAKWQRLIEVYSGHGNSELYRAFERPPQDADGRFACPTNDDGVELCCERAALLARERCEEPESAACDATVDAAVQAAAAVDSALIPLTNPLSAVPGTTLADWGACGQITDSFAPAWNYRPRQSAQYALALGSVDGETVPERFRWGFIAASDTHRSRPGTGYKEFGRQLMTDGVGYPMPKDAGDARGEAFYYTGGLTAVHAAGRDRESIFGALERREAYGTSGDRILLWFDLLAPDGTRHGMGSEVKLDTTPRFSVRAVGAREQKPGCPAFVHEALPAERIASLCLAECHHPSDRRRRIARIEIVRVRPQRSGRETIASRIEDPWQIFECDGDPAGCSVEFEDPDYAAAPGETAYYARAVQQPTDAVNGDPLQCERDEAGRCAKARLCGRTPDGLPDDCLAPVSERAWSSPIWLEPTRASELATPSSAE